MEPTWLRRGRTSLFRLSSAICGPCTPSVFSPDRVPVERHSWTWASKAKDRNKGVARLVACLGNTSKVLGLSPAPHKLDMEEHASDPSTCEAEVKGLRLWGHPQLHMEFEGSLTDRKPYVKNHNTAEETDTLSFASVHTHKHTYTCAYLCIHHPSTCVPGALLTYAPPYRDRFK